MIPRDSIDNIYSAGIGNGSRAYNRDCTKRLKHSALVRMCGMSHRLAHHLVQQLAISDWIFFGKKEKITDEAVMRVSTTLLGGILDALFRHGGRLLKYLPHGSIVARLYWSAAW